MKSTNEVIQEALKEINFEEIAKEAAISKVKETVREAVSSQLKSYSDFGKKLEEHIKKEIAVDLGEIRLPEYRAFLIGAVNNALAAYTTEEHAKEIIKYINVKVVGESRDEIEFSKFWDELCEKVNDECDEEDDEKYRIEVQKDDNSWSSSRKYFRLRIFLKGSRNQEIVHAAFSDGVVYHVRDYDRYELSGVMTWMKALQFRKTKITDLTEEEVSVPNRD